MNKTSADLNNLGSNTVATSAIAMLVGGLVGYKADCTAQGVKSRLVI